MADHEVRGMFDTTASTYDVQNRMLSLGRDRHWRRMFVRRLRLEPGSLVGDMCVGTAEIALGICGRYRDARVIGIDFSPGMMRVARRKIRAAGLEDRIELRRGDLRRLPLADGTFDAVTMSFGIRNIAERAQVLRECCRVLKPGGRLQIMEMAIPEGGLVGAVYGWYFDRIMPLVGNWLSRTDYAYSYLMHSVREFPREQAFLEELRAAGLAAGRSVPITLGTARIFSARKPAAGTRT